MGRWFLLLTFLVPLLVRDLLSTGVSGLTDIFQAKSGQYFSPVSSSGMSIQEIPLKLMSKKGMYWKCALDFFLHLLFALILAKLRENRFNTSQFPYFQVSIVNYAGKVISNQITTDDKKRSVRFRRLFFWLALVSVLYLGGSSCILSVKLGGWQKGSLPFVSWLVLLLALRSGAICGRR